MVIESMGRQMKDWSLPGVVDHPSCIVLDDATKNYVLKSFHLHNFPTFHGIATEEPLTFLHEFGIMLDSLPTNGATRESLKLNILPYTLKDAAHRRVLDERVHVLSSNLDLTKQLASMQRQIEQLSMGSQGSSK
ncbi:hypothetical protein LIER_32233 [Lithospermum erythrorhizon]|uniref:Uncharacterized protein n=1 Tax=Lithospermum erythrorhizon TaxID=34254 RepID=A0AAV3RVQ1_LITER